MNGRQQLLIPFDRHEQRLRVKQDLLTRARIPQGLKDVLSIIHQHPARARRGQGDRIYQVSNQAIAQALFPDEPWSAKLRGRVHDRIRRLTQMRLIAREADFETDGGRGVNKYRILWGRVRQTILRPPVDPGKGDLAPPGRLLHSMDPDPFCAFDENQSPPSIGGSMEPAVPAGGLLKRFSFKAHVTVDELSQPKRLWELWGEAVKAGLIEGSEVGAQEFFRLAHYCRRSAKRNPVGLLCGLLDGSALEKAKWKRPWKQRIAAEDEAWQRAAMRAERDDN